jgi:precorrin-6B methylase 2/DNA-binding PadR family transcriptional regulator
MIMKTTVAEKQIAPSQIMQVGMGFMAAKTLLAAVRFDLFTHLAEGPMTGAEIQQRLGLHPRSLYDFLDTLVALGFLKREGMKENAHYRNSEEADAFLDKKKPAYIGGILEMANNRLYKFWGNLEEALRTGEPQNEVKESGKSLFDALYSDPARLKEFITAMRGAQIGAIMAFAEKFDFSRYKTLCDIGGASGALAVQVARVHEHMTCTTADLPAVLPIAEQYIADAGLSDKVKTAALDFFKDTFPQADIITMGNILHDWGLRDKKMLIKKAYDALPQGGAFVVIENIIDDDRKSNVPGLLMSLNMLIETDAGFDYTFRDFNEWVTEAGFFKAEILPLTGPSSAAIAIK